MKAINPEQICYIEAFFKSKTNLYKIIPERKTWWGKVKSECVVGISSLLKDYNSIEEFLKEKTNFRVEDGVIYHKPHIEMYFSNQHTITKYFESVDEMNDFIKEELSGINLKIIG